MTRQACIRHPPENEKRQSQWEGKEKVRVRVRDPKSKEARTRNTELIGSSQLSWKPGSWWLWPVNSPYWWTRFPTCERRWWG